jgi:hypothetical protein
MRIELLQGLAYKLKVLKSRIGLQPQLGFHNVNTANRALLGSISQRLMILPTQVAFEPDQAVAHLGSLQLRQGHEIKCPAVRAFKHHWGCHPCVVSLPPSQGTQAPSIASHQSCETIFWPWGDQVIALFN